MKFEFIREPDGRWEAGMWLGKGRSYFGYAETRLGAFLRMLQAPFIL
jgi:hypothetical protein